MIATVVFYDLFAESVFYVLCLLGVFAAVAVMMILALEYGFRRGRRHEKMLIDMREVRSLRRFHEGRPL